MFLGKWKKRLEFWERIGIAIKALEILFVGSCKRRKGFGVMEIDGKAEEVFECLVGHFLDEQ